MYDLIIIGAGPAGISAAIYAHRYKLKTLILTTLIGGEVANTSKIENYPGIPSIEGGALADRFEDQVQKLGIKILADKVEKIDVKKTKFVLNEKFESRAVVLAQGTEWRKLGIPGEHKFKGRGVSYCATCDGAFFKDKVIAVIGGGDAAAKAALLLTNFASKIYVIHRRDELRAEPLLIDDIEKDKKIQLVFCNHVNEIVGDKTVEAVKLEHVKTGKVSEIKVDGVFVEIGSEPKTKLARSIGVSLDERGYIKIDQCGQRTNVPFVYAAGDITNGSCGFRQIVTACAEGALAAYGAYEDLKK